MLSRYMIARFLLSTRIREYAPCTRPFVSVGLDLDICYPSCMRTGMARQEPTRKVYRYGTDYHE